MKVNNLFRVNSYIKQFKNSKRDPNMLGPESNHHRSIRLKEYDYSSAGAYFVTVCTKDQRCFFGEIRAERWY